VTIIESQNGSSNRTIEITSVNSAALKRRVFTREFKLKVIREVEAGKPQAQRSRTLTTHPAIVSPVPP
jgi:hypothetical protein